jgi:hypothetical protein
MSDRRPLGIPVSRAILLPPGPLGDTLRPALEAIDRVHGDGILVQLAVTVEPTLADESRYRWVEPHGAPWDIAMRPVARHPRLNLIHEIGHFLDQQAIGSPGVLASPIDADFADWRNAVQNTNAVARLRAIARDSRYRRAVEYADYLLEWEEMWARSYAQFVTVRSGQAEPLAELRQRQRRAKVSAIPVQWEDDDFVLVEETISSLFRQLGWVT